MRLVNVEIAGFKRFADSTTLYVNGPIVAAVGPNEAGKTSLLEALEHLSLSRGFNRREFTDRVERNGDEGVVIATYVLEKPDLAALSASLPTNKRIEFTVEKRANGSFLADLDHELHRDFGLREDAVARLNSAVDRGRLKRIKELVEQPDGSEAAEDPPSIQETARELAVELDTDAEHLPDPVLERSRFVHDMLDRQVSKDGNNELKNLTGALETLNSSEDGDHPQDQAEERLLGLQPQFLRFGTADQDLKVGYRWDEHPDTPPAALANLLAMAEANYANLVALALDPERKDEFHTEQKRANRILKAKMEAWGQEKLAVAIFPDAEGIEIQIEDQETNQLTRLNERSAGLTRFVALIAFVYCYAERERAQPVLLIDEAETHLHYEAQADLVKVLERQAAAQTVIYTTHSIGCLPEDLGSAIRVVETTGHERSRIRPSAWTGTVGLTPMVLAMGANALAFTPARFAVIGEGPTDAILLPTLFREARPRSELREPIGFQVAPGVSEVHEDAAAELEIEAGSVVYLIDSDPGGRDHVRKLSQRAKDEGRIVELKDGKESGLCTEDFVSAKILVEAFNGVVEDTRPTISDRLDVSELPATGRGSWLGAWCKERGAPAIGKTHLAERILEVGRAKDAAIVESDRKPELRALRKKLLDKLAPPET